MPAGRGAVARPALGRISVAEIGCGELMNVYPASVLSRAGARQNSQSGRIGNREFVFFELMELKKIKNICDRAFLAKDGK